MTKLSNRSFEKDAILALVILLGLWVPGVRYVFRLMPNTMELTQVAWLCLNLLISDVKATILVCSCIFIFFIFCNLHLIINNCIVVI